ncbi:MAG: sugar phosphate nucleotidyltransferase [Candidatus Korarchaeum sp.]
MKVALILAGGFGTRLWPLSRKDFPKQFAKIMGETSTYQQSLGRARLMADRIVVVTSSLYKYLAIGQAEEIGISLEDLILEPERKNTAPAIYYSLMEISKRYGPDSITLLLPSDHVVSNDSELLRAYSKALAAVNLDRAVLIAVPPSKPEPGLGYVKLGRELIDGVSEVREFKEKPGFDDAVRMLNEGGWVWNTLIMVFKTSIMMDLIERTLPGVADPIRKFGNLEEAYRYVQSVDVSSGTLSKVPEKLATVVAQGLGWSDLGSFESVYELFQKDSEGNARSGRVRYSNARNNLILSKRLVALVDVSDMIVVDDEDAILVMPKGSGQNLKELVESMLDERLPEVMEHRVRYESWGTKTILLTGDSYEVSRLKLYPGRSLGPKRHFHRFIYWQVLSGTAKVTVDGDERIISRGEGIRVPLGAPHTLVNVGRIPLEVIEIATGEYLGSDDIEFLR